MRTLDIPKGNGKMRRLYIPSRDEAAASRAVVHQIAQRAEKACPAEVPHGFTRRRSPVTNAMAHVGHQYTLTMDLRDFFDSVDEAKLKGKIPDDMLPAVLYDGAARQGLPSSPACANLAAAPIDHAILKMIDKKKLQVVYTRYADDLTFSYDDDTATDTLIAQVSQIVRRCGFKIADDKTHLYAASQGRRMVTGVAVDDGIHPTREAKRKLRAAKHQAAKGVPAAKERARGMAEWCKLKVPRQRATAILESAEIEDQLRKLAKVWNLGNIHFDKVPDKGPDVDLGGSCIITGDPVLMLGMSTYTTGWTSCARQPSGSHRRGPIFWMHLRGTRIAALMSDKTGVYGGVERQLMRARSLVHELRDGTLVYDRIYGDPESAEVLRKRIVESGIISVSAARSKHKGQKVVGHAPAGWKAYFDNLKSSTSTASAGRWSGKNVRVVYV